MTNADRSLTLRRWLAAAPPVLFLIDALLVLAHLWWGARCELLHLHTDASLPGWYIGAKLLLMAVLAWWFGLDVRGPRRRERALLWHVAALGFVGLSMEKTLQLHQRAGRLFMHTGAGDALRQTLAGGDTMKDAYGWVIVLLPVMLAMLYFLVAFFREEFRHDGRTLAWWFTGLGLALCHPLLELDVYGFAPINEWTAQTLHVYAAISLVRRTTELAALSCLLIALLRHLRCTLERPR